MLSLTRRDGEGVQIGPDIAVALVNAARGRVRLLVDLPSDTALDLAGDVHLVVAEKASGRVQFHIAAPPQLEIVRTELLHRSPADTD